MKMLKTMLILSVLLLSFILATSYVSASDQEISNKGKSLLKEMEKHEIKLKVKNPEEVKSTAAKKVKKDFSTIQDISGGLEDESLTIEDIEEELETNNNDIYVQVFENDNEEVLAQRISSLEDLYLMDITPSEEILEENKENAYFPVSYSVVVTTPQYTGVHDFDRFFINDINEMTLDEKTAVLEYGEQSNLEEGIEMSFHENTEEVTALDEDSVSIACIACVGYIPSGTTYETKWTNVAQVHSIKGVKTTFSLNNSKTVLGSLQVKTVFPSGSVELGGTKSVSSSTTETYPTLQHTSLTSSGRMAQTQIRYSKTRYKHPNGNEYTKVSPSSVVGGTNWGSYVSGNGASFSSVSGVTYLPGSTRTQSQTSTNTFTAAASVSVYGSSIGLNSSISTGATNKWTFNFLTGQGYSSYKIYNVGTKNNLTAK